MDGRRGREREWEGRGGERGRRTRGRTREGNEGGERGRREEVSGKRGDGEGTLTSSRSLPERIREGGSRKEG